MSLFRVWLTWRRAPSLVMFLLQLCPLETCNPVWHTEMLSYTPKYLEIIIYWKIPGIFGHMYRYHSQQLFSNILTRNFLSFHFPPESILIKSVMYSSAPQMYLKRETSGLIFLIVPRIFSLLSNSMLKNSKSLFVTRKFSGNLKTKKKCRENSHHISKPFVNLFPVPIFW